MREFPYKWIRFEAFLIRLDFFQFICELSILRMRKGQFVHKMYTNLYFVFGCSVPLFHEYLETPSLPSCSCEMHVARNVIQRARPHRESPSVWENDQLNFLRGLLSRQRELGGLLSSRVFFRSEGQAECEAEKDRDRERKTGKKGATASRPRIATALKNKSSHQWVASQSDFLFNKELSLSVNGLP